MMNVQERCEEVILMLQTIKSCIDEEASDEFNRTVLAGCGQESTKFVIDEAIGFIAEIGLFDLR
jgi:hypothetical protein